MPRVPLQTSMSSKSSKSSKVSGISGISGGSDAFEQRIDKETGGKTRGFQEMCVTTTAVVLVEPLGQS